MKKIFVTIPSIIKSTDKDKHLINHRQLIHLYDVPNNLVANINEKSKYSDFSIKLIPKKDGNYSIEEAYWETVDYIVEETKIEYLKLLKNMSIFKKILFCIKLIFKAEVLCLKENKRVFNKKE